MGVKNKGRIAKDAVTNDSAYDFSFKIIFRFLNMDKKQAFYNREYLFS